MRNPEERSHFREVLALLHDGSSYVGDREIYNDIKTLSRRFSNEGITFLTNALPLLGKAIDTALSGNVAFQTPSCFRKAKRGVCAFPLFLGSALRKIFDDNGRLREHPDPSLIRWIRTFCFFSYKLEAPFSQSKISEYSTRFVAVDHEIGSLLPDDIQPEFRNIMRNHLSHILKEYRLGSPSDGPGISTDRPRSMKRYPYTEPSSLRAHFGRDFFMQPLEARTVSKDWHMPLHVFRKHGIPDYLRIFLEAFGHCLGLDDLGTQTPSSNWKANKQYSKVIFVPKDSRGPRVICCEPADNMYAQQAVRKGLYNAVENSPLTCGRVNFTDQSINQELTFDPGNATLDLKEASDRVSYALVRDLFPPHLFSDMDVCRTPNALLPDGTEISLAKFAPMGNALCFPVMALLAYTSVCSAIYQAGGVLPSKQNQVYVYGDDIIVPNIYADVAIRALESVGLLVNRSKSYINSRFRESCGQDTFDTSTVTPLRRRKLLRVNRLIRNGQSKHREDDGYAVHTAAVMNQAVDLGFINLAIQLETNLRHMLKSPVPYGTSESSYICHIVSNPDVAWRLNEESGYSKNGKLRAWAYRDSDGEIRHSSYSRLRASFRTNECPITGDVTPGYLKYGLRSPVLHLRTLRQWWKGSFV